MRLPQSINQSLSVRTVHFLTIGAVLLLVCLAPISAGATAPQLACSPSRLQFGRLDVGQSEALLVSVTNSGQSSITLSGIAMSNPVFTTPAMNLPVVVPAGASVNLSVTFTAQAIGFTSGTITFTSNASNPTLILELGGTGVTSETLTASPASLSFGPVATGSHSTLPVVITNARSWEVTLSSPEISDNEFSASGATFPLNLKAGQSATLNVTFTPQSTGVAGGSLFIYASGLNVPLTGTGTATGQLSIAPAPLNFGKVSVGTTETESISMSATGGSVTVYSAASGNSQYVLNGGSFPLTISVGQNVSLNVAFTPQSAGVQSGSLSFTSNASNSQSVESLTGTGIVTQYSVNLWWNPSQDVQGYNVYRSSAANGPYSRINPTLNPGTTYTDTGVAAGQTYYYEATAVSPSGQESSRSTPPVQASVP